MEKPLKKQLVEFQFEFSDMQVIPENPQFSYGKAKILYENLNRNNSYLTPDSVKNALPTLFGIPIVGEYDSEKNNFGGHGGKVEITDKGVEYIDTTIPYGYVSEKSNIYKETIQELNGMEREYLVADRCVFWTGRYPHLNALKNSVYNQSMEIDVNNGEFAIIDGNETFRVDDFTFSALCILGISTEEDPNGHVEPCFESATIEIYNQETSQFQLKFNEMITAFSNQEGGQSVAEKTKETEVEVETAENKEKEVEEVNASKKEETEEEFGKVQITEVETTESTTTMVELDENNNPKAETEVVTTDKTEEVSVSTHETPEDMPMDERYNAETFAILAQELAAEKLVSSSLTQELETANANFATLETENKKLREFKRTTELNQLTEKFSGKLEDDILKSTIEANADKTIVELEGLIFAEIGKQNFSHNKKEKEVPASYSVPVNETQETQSYGGLFAQYGKSN